MIQYLPILSKNQEKKAISIPEKVSELLSDNDCKIIVAFSGGKDSVAMVLYLFELGISKDRIELHHHDVDGGNFNLFDWKCTPSYCKAFAKAFHLPIKFSWREGGIYREMYRTNEGLQDVLYLDENGDKVRLTSKEGSSTRRKFPAVSADLRTRWCSAVVKIQPFSRYISSEYSSKEKHTILVCTGERRQESRARSKYKDFDLHSTHSILRKSYHWRPVIDFKEKEVWALYEKYKVQPHPCYELGWSRCSCQLCIFSSANTWASLFELQPEKIYKIGGTENNFGFTLYNKSTIYDKVEKGESFLNPAKVLRWKNELLGEFISPIIVDIWQLPQGAFAVEGSGAT
jgi:3'-phosphoadenosine 5'-phosphosulfate sulfotransferase (PAPS reductase)/FAD synthetase